MDKEHKREIEQEEAEERRKEPMFIWIEENKEELKTEYLDLYEDEFMQYCIGEYEKRQ